jgi:diadenosine tetraphosphate (Ap4A) HIT family hydrolase
MLTFTQLEPNQITVSPNSVSPNSVRQAASAAATECKLQSCILCDVQRGVADSFTRMTGLSPMLSLSNLSPNLAVMMDSFPIGDGGGHLLIVPKTHYSSLAEFPDSENLAFVVQTTARILQEMFPDHWLFTFEHGPGAIDEQRVKCGGCHVDHAHGHIVLLKRSTHFDDIRDLTEETLSGLDWDVAAVTTESATPFMELSAQVGSLPYLQIGMLDAERSQAVTYRQTDSEKTIPSQLLRRLVATAVGTPEPMAWNWKIAQKQNATKRLNQYRDQGVSFKTAVEQHLTQNKI